MFYCHNPSQQFWHIFCFRMVTMYIFRIWSNPTNLKKNNVIWLYINSQVFLIFTLTGKKETIFTQMMWSQHGRIIALRVWTPRDELWFANFSTPHAWLGCLYVCALFDRWLKPWHLSIASALWENRRISRIHINLGHWLPYCPDLEHVML